MPRADETCSMSKTVTKFQTCLLNSKQTSEKKRATLHSERYTSVLLLEYIL